MESLNLESAELVRLVVVGVILLGGLAVLRWVFKLTTRILTMGCLGAVVILAVLLIMAVAS